MLQLLLERGQSYEDISGLLGLGMDDVRARARAALTEMGGEDPDREVGLTDYLLGQADPIGRADAARQLQSDPDTRALAEKLISQLRLVAPGAELPSLPEAKAPRRARAAETAATPAAAGEAARPGEGGGSNLSPGQRQLVAGLLGIGLVVVLVVLIVAGAFSGGGSDKSSASSSGGATGATGANSAAAQRLTRAVLEPVGGSKASGAAIFGRVRQGKNDVAVVQLAMSGLAPTKKGQIYVIWLHGKGGNAFPLTRDQVTKSGQLRGLVPLQPQLLQTLAAGAFDSVAVTLASEQQVLAELRTSGKGKKLPKLVGTLVLDGKVVGPGFRAARAAAQAQQGASGASGSTGG